MTRLVATEVAHLDGALKRDETVPCRQIAVHQARALEVVHRRGYLGRHVQQQSVAETRK
jgi:hypothetical protein